MQVPDIDLKQGSGLVGKDTKATETVSQELFERNLADMESVSNYVALP